MTRSLYNDPKYWLWVIREEARWTETRAITVRTPEASVAELNDAPVVGLWLHGRPETTREVYQRDVGRFLVYLDEPLEFLTVLQRYADALEEGGFSLSSRRRMLSAVNSLLRSARSAAICASMSARRFVFPRARRLSVVSIIDGLFATVIDGERKSFPFPLPDLSDRERETPALRRQACSRPEF